MNKKLKLKIHESLSAVIPITLIVLALGMTVVPMELSTLMLFLAGAALLILGMGFFTLGADMAMMPIGEQVGTQLTRSKRLWLIVAACFVIGVIITVAEPDRDGALAILRGLRSRYESYHHLTVTDGALSAAVDLSIRYLPGRFLPDKAIDLLDEGCARARLSGRTLPPELKNLEERAAQAGRQMALAIREQNFEKAAMLRDAEGDFRRALEEGRRRFLQVIG